MIRCCYLFITVPRELNKDVKHEKCAYTLYSIHAVYPTCQPVAWSRIIIITRELVTPPPP